MSSVEIIRGHSHLQLSVVALLVKVLPCKKTSRLQAGLLCES